ncbi:hypothetical protein [Parvibaculum sp.]|uniref:hypothetical protein n=1 Tax=Parvibaculum sp. TaxID=2024848 RepID=UPI000C47E547|nr:hypothetical protein [Parvibaculum sp.]MAM93281.1 hypothetical protein [Parvibaculum sp.]|tara:strand:+ start:23364 stop:23783 length:420 start_codon:yes stop_codon:yes gene_type:complete
MNKHPAANLLVIVLAILIGMGPAWCGCLDSASHKQTSETASSLAHEHCVPSAAHDTGQRDVFDECEIACPECAGATTVDDAVVAAKAELPSADYHFVATVTDTVRSSIVGITALSRIGQRDPPPLMPTTLFALRTLLLN